MTAQERLIGVAEDQVGYMGKRSNSQLDEYKSNTSGLWNKYARDLDALGDFYNGRKNGYDWCDVFVDWCFVTTFGRSLGQKLLGQPDRSLGAGTGYSLKYYQQMGRLFSKPEPGDQIFFGDSQTTWHTGIVSKVENGYVHTIEGNAGNPSAVRAGRYVIGGKNIKGYGRPDWSLVPEDKPEEPAKSANKKSRENLQENEKGYREVLGAAEGMKEDKASWVSFFQWLRNRGLDGVKLMVGDKCLGMLEAVGEVFPEAKYQRCTVHFYRNVFSVIPRCKVKLVAKMLKAIHAQESKKAAREKAKAVAEELRAMNVKEASKKVEDGIEETLTYCDFPGEHWTRIRTNNVIERLNREIRRRTRVVGCFPDGNSALMLVCARLRHVAGTQWGNKKYMNMKHLEVIQEGPSVAS